MHPLVDTSEITGRVNEFVGKRFTDVEVRVVYLDFYIRMTRQRLQKDSIIFDQEIVTSSRTFTPRLAALRMKSEAMSPT